MTSQAGGGSRVPALRIAVQGVPGCFSEQAALQLHPEASIYHCTQFSDLFTALGVAADAAIVPIENTLAGKVEETQALLRQHRDEIDIAAEVPLRIELCLMLHPASSMDDIREVLSHPVALRQCKKFFAQHPDWRAVPFFDTAGSVEEAVRRGAAGEFDTAAIASARAATVYGAMIAARGIGDQIANFTRFFLVTAPGASVLRKEGRGERQGAG
jgi:prephenate dehydratase